ncbi:MAG: LysR family transcriptional regulator [Clostridia bacterium]|nr:LysR family transcriptional regulator [Clostridia bacterium]MBP3706963.1 LysR family transcriptional regulator [Clostridia bacterium]
MKTKLDYYRVFYETARFSSFSIAARHLYVSQSAISQCISQLEKDLGAHLFVRSRRGVSLTKEGILLFQKVENAMQSIEQGETLLARLHHLDSGSLIIAAGDTITGQYLLPYLEQFHENYPNIRIEMANSYSSRMLQCVKEGKAELAFVNLPVTDDELCIKPCLEIHDIFVCGSEYSAKKSYTWSEIAQLPLILLEENSNSRRYIDEKFKEKKIILKPQIEMAVHDLLIRFASIHLGVSCVVEEFSKESLDSGIIKPLNLNPPLPPRSIGCAYLKHNSLSPAAKAFLKLIK